MFSNYFPSAICWNKTNVENGMEQKSYQKECRATAAARTKGNDKLTNTKKHNSLAALHHDIYTSFSFIRYWRARTRTHTHKHINFSRFYHFDQQRVIIDTNAVNQIWKLHCMRTRSPVKMKRRKATTTTTTTTTNQQKPNKQINTQTARERNKSQCVDTTTTTTATATTRGAERHQGEEGSSRRRKRNEKGERKNHGQERNLFL